MSSLQNICKILKNTEKFLNHGIHELNSQIISHFYALWCQFVFLTCFFFFFPGMVCGEVGKGLEFLSVEISCLERGQMLKQEKKSGTCFAFQRLSVYTEILINEKIASCTSINGFFSSI